MIKFGRLSYLTRLCIVWNGKIKEFQHRITKPTLIGMFPMQCCILGKMCLLIWSDGWSFGRPVEIKTSLQSTEIKQWTNYNVRNCGRSVLSRSLMRSSLCASVQTCEWVCSRCIVCCFFSVDDVFTLKCM